MDENQPLHQTSRANQMVLDSDEDRFSSTGMSNIARGDTGSPSTMASGSMSSHNNSNSTNSPSSQQRTSNEHSVKILTKSRLQELVKEIDPTEQLDEDVEDVLLQIADEFVESTVKAACALAKHRKSNTVDVKDVQLYLERTWNMWIPGFGTDELRPYRRSNVTEAHRQRMALIRKQLKKY